QMRTKHCSTCASLSVTTVRRDGPSWSRSSRRCPLRFAPLPRTRSTFPEDQLPPIDLRRLSPTTTTTIQSCLPFPSISAIQLHYSHLFQYHVFYFVFMFFIISTFLPQSCCQPLYQSNCHSSPVCVPTTIKLPCVYCALSLPVDFTRPSLY